MSIFFIMW